MNRVFSLQTVLLQVIAEQEGRLPRRDEPLDWERVHMASCARLAWQMAEERDVDPELAACAASIHDLGRILTGRQEGHAQAAEGAVRELLAATRLFEDWQVEAMTQAVVNHSKKGEVGTPLEEVVKDADVVDCVQYGIPMETPEWERRYRAWDRRYAIEF